MTSPTKSTRFTRSRRRFLTRVAVGSSLALAGSRVTTGSSALGQLNVACVGVKGMGFADLSNVGKHSSVRFVGFCDIDSERFDQADKQFANVDHFVDYREMLTKLSDRVDAVIVSTPDHMHAPVAMMAMSLGKHVYCQKPLAHTVWEVRQMRLLAAKKNLTTQMGNQIHSASEYRTGVRWIHDGLIGKVHEVHSWVGVNGRQYCNRLDRPTAIDTPRNVAWDLWLGSAPERPFSPDVYHPFKWRDWQDFGSGALGDFGCHLLDPVFGALELTAPISVSAIHDGINEEVWPGPETVVYTFPGTRRTSASTVQVTWRDGGLQPPVELAQLPEGVGLPKSGSLFIGESGVMLLPHVGMPSIYERGKKREIAEKVPGGNHWHAWVDAILEGKKTTDGFDFAGPVAETVQLGNIAARLPGSLIEWDSQNFMIRNSKSANRLLTKSYRPGFEVKPA